MENRETSGPSPGFFEGRREAAPWWLVVMLMVAAAWLLYGLYRDVFRNLIAMAPMAGIVAYLLVALLVNRTHVRLDAEGFRRRFGPLPLGPREAPLPAGDVKLVFVRYALASTGRSSSFFLRAGIETRDGRLVDITEPGMEEAAVWEAAREMAGALGGRVPVTPLEQRQTHLPKADVEALVLWLAAAFGAGVWAIAVSLARAYF